MTDLYQRVCHFDNLYTAYLAAKKGQNKKNPVTGFERGLLCNLSTLQKRLKNKTYRVGQYNTFVVTEPKRRIISSLPFRDRVVQHALCQVILPRLEKHFIAENAANRMEKGTHYAIKMFTRQLVVCHRDLARQNLPATENLWCLKADISGFFYNIDREVMKAKLTRLFGKDQDLMWLINTIIDSSPDYIRPETQRKIRGKGLPIGNLTSQFFAIYYLSNLDHFIKEKLGIKHYVRYMDDFTLLHPDKKYLEYCRGEIARFLVEDCRLNLNEKTQIFAMKQGVDFLGWHFYIKEPTGKIVRLLRRDSKERRRRKNKKLMKAYPSLTTYAERLDFMAHFEQSMASWRGHAKHGDTYRLVNKIYGEVRFVNNNK